MKIYLTGGDNAGWALDTDYRLAELAIEKFAHVEKALSRSDFIHSVWPDQYYRLLTTSNSKIKKPFIAVFQGDPVRIMESTPGFLEFCRKSYCIAQSSSAEKKLKDMGIENVYKVPYIADLETFYPIEKNTVRQKYGLSESKFIIANFMRDSLGNNLFQPKPEKGPDIFCEIVDEAVKVIGKEKLHILLGGPRRHWIIKRLKELDIGFTYIGRETVDDDYNVNLLQVDKINELINCADLMLITSRSEGGPRAILEASAARVPIISTNVGIARDVLHPEAIINDIPQAVNLLIKHYKTNYLSKFVDYNENNVKKNHSIDVISKMWEYVYKDISSRETASSFITRMFQIYETEKFYKIKARLILELSKFKKKKIKTICLWGIEEKKDDDYLNSVVADLLKRNICLVLNQHEKVDAHIIYSGNNNNVDFSLLNAVKGQNAPFFHYISADIMELSKDARSSLINFNKVNASTTFFDNYYRLKQCLEAGINLANPTIAPSLQIEKNIFFKHANTYINTERNKIVVVSVIPHNKIKNMSVYNYIDRYFDYSRYHFILITKLKVEFTNIEVYEDLDSFKNQNSNKCVIYFYEESGSITEIENALNCRLPVVYQYSPQIQEIVGMAGISFSNISEITSKVDTAYSYYEHLQNVIINQDMGIKIDAFLNLSETYFTR